MSKVESIAREELVSEGINRAEMEFKMMVYKMMVAKNHQESMAWAERAYDKELALEALEEELRNSR